MGNLTTLETRAAKSAGFDAVVSNPPFQNQLRSRTAMDRGLAALVRARAAGETSAYTDAAAVFLRLGLELVREGGSVGMLLPLSILASRDAAPARASAGRVSRLLHLWVSGEQTFDRALVSTCGLVFTRSVTDGSWPLTRAVSLGFEAAEGERLSWAAFSGLPTWAPLMAPALGVPRVFYEHGGVVGDIASATADFRDEYYALRGLVTEARPDRGNDHAPVLTSGLIGLAECHWGTKPTRIHKARFGAPCLDLDRCAIASVQRWLQKRLVPKVLLATQTRAIEALADEAGHLVPCLPVISVAPIAGTTDVWRLASAIASPVCTLVAWQRHAGTALTSEAIKLAARDVLRLPLPVRARAWDLGASAFRSLQSERDLAERERRLRVFGEVMCDAYGLTAQDTERLLKWWTPRALNVRERKKTAPA